MTLVGLPGDEVADGLEAGPRPAHVKGPGDLLIAAGHHRGGQQEGIFQLHPAEGAGQVHRGLPQLLHAGLFPMESRAHPADGDGLVPAQAGGLAGGVTPGAQILPGQPPGGAGLIFKAEAAQEPRRVQPVGAGRRTGRLVAQQAAAHVLLRQRHSPDHGVTLPFPRLRASRPDRQTIAGILSDLEQLVNRPSRPNRRKMSLLAKSGRPAPLPPLRAQCLPEGIGAGGNNRRAPGAKMGSKNPQSIVTQWIAGFFGPSDWIRTSGLLNPIQARYQTSPHPDFAVVPDSSYILPRPREKSKPFFKKISAEFFAPPRGGEGRRGRLRTARGGPAHRPRTGRFPPPR